MKGKKLLAGIMSAAMVLCTMAIPAFADETAVAKIGDTEYTSLKEAMQAACNMNVVDVNGVPTQTTAVTVELINDIAITDGISVRGGSVNTYGEHYVHNINITLKGNNHKIDTGVHHSDINGPTRVPLIEFVSAGGQFTVENVIAPNDLLFRVMRPEDAVSQCGHGQPLCDPAESLLVENCTFYGSNNGYIYGVKSVTYRNNKFLLTENANDNSEAYPLWYNFQYGLPSTFTFDGNIVNSQRPVQLCRMINNENIIITNNKFTVTNSDKAAKAGAIMFASIDGYKGNVTFSGNTVNAYSTVIIYAPSDNNTNFNLTIGNNTLENKTKLIGYNEWSGSYQNEETKATAETLIKNFESKVNSWESDTDSGYYMVGETKYGMMRFMFKTEPTGTVTASGIKYINAKDISKSVTSTTAAGATVFQGDVVKVDEGTEGTYYARAYITT